MSILLRLSLFAMMWPLSSAEAEVISIPQDADVSPEEYVSVYLNDGHIACGHVDERTDGQRLWLRVDAPWMMLISGYRWERVQRVVATDPPQRTEPIPLPPLPDMSPLPEPELHRFPEVPLSRLPQNLNESRYTPSASSVRIHEWSDEDTRSLSSLHIEATLANWDRDAATDGLRVRVIPTNTDGLPVRVRGTIDFELVGERHHTNQSHRLRDDVAFPTLGRWSMKIEPDDADTWGTVVNLPFRNFHPQTDLDIDAQGLLTARLRVPRVGTFEATDAWVALRPVNRLRDDYQLQNGRRYISPEQRPRTVRSFSSK
ncbi:MAG: hypothetical protein KDA93_11380 [Planctomycetaceae bacterium]|nr:hypothetical protein [Planctomycetaceae bacterium]